jgi:hypothetical protein
MNDLSKDGKTVMNDGIKYSKEKQSINEETNIPAGVKKPKITIK